MPLPELPNQMEKENEIYDPLDNVISTQPYEDIKDYSSLISKPGSFFKRLHSKLHS